MKWGSERNRRVFNVLDANEWIKKGNFYLNEFKVFVLKNRIFFPEITKKDRMFTVHCWAGKDFLLQDTEFMLPIMALKHTMNGRMIDWCIIMEERDTYSIMKECDTFKKMKQYLIARGFGVSVDFVPSKEHPFPTIYDGLIELQMHGRWMPLSYVVALRL